MRSTDHHNNPAVGNLWKKSARKFQKIGLLISTIAPNEQYMSDLRTVITVRNEGRNTADLVARSTAVLWRHWMSFPDRELHLIELRPGETGKYRILKRVKTPITFWRYITKTEFTLYWRLTTPSSEQIFSTKCTPFLWVKILCCRMQRSLNKAEQLLEIQIVRYSVYLWKVIDLLLSNGAVIQKKKSCRNYSLQL